MMTDILREYALLSAMSPAKLLVEWKKYYDRPPQARGNKTYLINQILYRIQELTYGGLTKKTIDRLEALAEGKEINLGKPEPGCLAVGTQLVREVKGVEHHVTVLSDGYEYQGAKYRSLSGVAFAITGTRWNGPVFFGVGRKEKTQPRKGSAA